MRWQAEWCDRLGSPLYGELLRRAADDAEAGGPVAEALAGHEEDPLESMLQLRFMGAVHRLALAGEAPELAALYPSCGGGGAVAGAWEPFRTAVAVNLDDLRSLVRNPVQTNEVGRSRALALGFLTLAEETGLPLRLLEVGSSAGLNLRWDGFRYAAGGFSFGDRRTRRSSSPATPTARSPHCPTRVRIAERAGCDEAPVRLDDDGRLTLRSYLWPDQLDRLRVLDGALEVAPSIPVSVERSGAADWLERRLAEPAAGECTVVFHSIVMQYVDADERERVARCSPRRASAPARTRRWRGSCSSPAESSRTCA